MKRIAVGHLICKDGTSRRNVVVELEQGESGRDTILRIYPIKEELPNTIWFAEYTEQ